MILRAAHGIVLLAAIALSSCVSKPLATDVVRDADTAIAIAKKTCVFPNDAARRWTAWLHDGVWDVRQYYPGESGACGWRGAKVRASDGYTGDLCESCTVTR